MRPQRIIARYPDIYIEALNARTVAKKKKKKKTRDTDFTEKLEKKHLNINALKNILLNEAL